MKKWVFKRSAAIILAAIGFSLFIFVDCQDPSDEKMADQYYFYPDSKPYTRWWWFADEIEKDDIVYQLDWLKKNNFGGVEIAWVYPYCGDTAKTRYKFLGKAWAEAVLFAKSYATEIGLSCDFTFGSLWPFGGSFVDDQDATRLWGDSECSQWIRFSWEHPVKGRVLNHLDKKAFQHYADSIFAGLDPALEGKPSAWFCDSWEVETQRIWTAGFDSVFEQRYGYDITNFMEKLYDSANAQVNYDYMKLVSDFVIEEFYKPFTETSHRHNSFSRAQCGGAPADLLDAFAAVDVPESEAILFEPEFSRIPASAAALSSKTEVSSETFTCLYGWKRWPGPGPYQKMEQMADLKLLADALFAHGVNQIFWHGMPFNGEKDSNIFYASVQVGSDSHFANELPAFNNYLQKVSSAMKMGKAFSQAAVYLPLEDAWVQGAYPEELQLPWAWGAYELRYIKPADELNGYAPLWINQGFLKKSKLENGKLVCGDAAFSFLYMNVDYLDSEALHAILDLAGKGFPVCLKKLPKEPGYLKSNDYSDLLNKLISLENVGQNLSDIDIPASFIQCDPPLDYWCREVDGQYLLFFSHPLSQELKYPLAYGQSFCEKDSTLNISINLNGKGKEIDLVFKPYQSILLKIDEEMNVHFEDIFFHPSAPISRF
ncbi:MAG: hypothetical protein K9H64_06835 [Bacteroidales bacterium]|nr:hypothetical protein [Bacteroidales bacterium]MCF8455359.1 hypothetical protein [Bacteroidales bacterium]